MALTFPDDSRTCVVAGSGGFTFIEILVSLAILIIVVTTILHCHVAIIGAEERTRSLEDSRLMLSRIANEAWLATSMVETIGQDVSGWDVRFEPLVLTEGTNQVTWNRWTISPTNNPLIESELYLKAPPVKDESKRGTKGLPGKFGSFGQR